MADVRPSIVRIKSFDFALESIGLYRKLLDQREYVLSKQFLKCSTSIGANVEEASAAQSTRDFLSKMTIASKEARESLYWLRLMDASGLAQVDVRQNLLQAEELVRILTAIVKTTSEKLTNP